MAVVYYERRKLGQKEALAYACGMLSRSLVVLFAFVFLGGCNSSLAAPLLELRGITPKRIELGDKLEIEGGSLPEGRDARVVFRGVVFRPGEKEEQVDVDLSGRVVSRDRILIPVTSDFVESICGHGRAAKHSTFFGSAEVAFASQTPGEPPVTGSVRDARIDVLPTAGAAPDDVAGVATLGLLGIHPADSLAGVVVGSVEKGSRADQAAIAAGDRLTQFGGVDVFSAGDIAFAPGSSHLDIAVLRAGVSFEEHHSISVEGITPTARASVSLGLTLAALVAISILAFLGPPARALAWLERKLGDGLRIKHTMSTTTLFLAIFVALVALPFAQPVFGIRVDTVVIALAIVMTSGALAVSRANGFRAKVIAGISSLGRSLPIFAACVVATTRNGSLTAIDALRTQGALPWETTAARSPVGVFMVLAMLSPWAFRSRQESRESAHLDASIVFACALTTTWFLGGWRWFGGGTAVTVAGCLLFVLKILALFALTRWIRKSLPPLSARDWIQRIVVSSFFLMGVDLICQRAHVTDVAGVVLGTAVTLLFGLVTWRAVRIAQGKIVRIHANVLL